MIKPRKNTMSVAEWLQERVKNPAWVADLKSEISGFAWDVPIGWRTVQKLKKALGIKTYHAKAGWVWYHPQISLLAVKMFAEDSFPSSMPVTPDGLTAEEIRGMVVMSLADPDRPGEFRTATQVELIVMKECRSTGLAEKMTSAQVSDIIRCQVADEMGRPADPE